MKQTLLFFRHLGMRKAGLLPRCAALVFSLALCGPVSAADMNKTLHAVYRTAETGFDPAQVSDVFSNDIIRSIFDPLLTYDWLARPVKLVPNVTEGMPQVNADATEFIFKIRPGIYFADHPAFGGKRRELVAADYVFSLKRIIDPGMRSPNNYMFDGKFLGADKLLAQAKKSGKFDYDAPLEGVSAPERYTLRIRLTRPDHNFLYFLATVNTSAVAREVVASYSMQDMMAHPVGTGPYLLKEWVRGSKMVLEANPGYRHEVFNAQAGTDPVDQQIMREMRGKTLPQIGRIEVAVIEEAQPRWLAFVAGDIDYMILPPDFYPRALPQGKLPPDLQKRGVRHQNEVSPGTFYSFFNLDDPLLGGYSLEKIALRRALCYAYRLHEEIAQIYYGQAIPAQGPLSPGVGGYDPTFRTDVAYDLSLAKALLDRYGYKDQDGDGYRDMPDGSKLEIVKGSTPSSQDQILDEIWKRSMDALGIRMSFNKQKWPDLVKTARLGKLQMWNIGWAAQIPDGDTYLQLLYGGNKGANNLSRFDLPAFNQRYEQARRLPQGAQRDRLYAEMSQLAQGYGVWHMGMHRVENHLLQPWLKGYKMHPYLTNAYKYMDIDPQLQKSQTAKR